MVLVFILGLLAYMSPILFWILLALLTILSVIVSLGKRIKKIEQDKIPGPPQKYIDMISDTRITLPSRRKK